MPHGGDEHKLPFSGCRMAFVGRFSSMTQIELSQLVVSLGGAFDRLPSRKTNVLAVGGEELPLAGDAKPSAAIAKARELESAGYPIEVITEEEFWRRTGLQEHSQIKRRYTIGQLTKLIGVSRDTLRRWMRASLIAPSEVVHRLAFFDLAEVQSAKVLCELTKNGYSTSRIRNSLEQVRNWLPLEADVSLRQLSVLAERGEMVLRLGDSRLVEPSGQFRLNFDEPQEATVQWQRPDTVCELFLEGVRCEDADDWAAAAKAYRAAIEIDGNNSTLHFNLANAEYASGEFESAAANYLRAVQVDPVYAEAWNNLGCVTSELGRTEEAIVALRNAIELVPNYGDAHFNLADLLADQGETAIARKHWRRYLELDSEGPWADEARERLLALEHKASS